MVWFMRTEGLARPRTEGNNKPTSTEICMWIENLGRSADRQNGHGSNTPGAVPTIVEIDPPIPNHQTDNLGTSLHDLHGSEQPAIALNLFRATATWESATERHQNLSISDLHTSTGHLDHREERTRMLATAPCPIENQMRHSQALKLLWEYERRCPTAHQTCSDITKRRVIRRVRICWYLGRHKLNI